MKIKYNLISFLLLLGLFIVFTTKAGDDIPDNLLFFRNYRFVKEIPLIQSHQILLVSNRYFNPEQDSILKKGVHPEKKMFYFVVSLQGDSIYLTPFHKLEDALKTFSVNRDFLMFVNGYGKNFGQNLLRGFEIDKRYNLNVIIFDWPTDYQPARKSSHNARLVTGNFLKLVYEFDEVHKEYFKNTSASLVFHSMGNHIARKIAAKQDIGEISGFIFDNIVLNAAGVKQFNHDKWVEKLKIQDRIYITSNNQDKTLKLLKLARLSTQLGSQAKKARAVNAIYIDFSKIAGEEHNYFIGRSNIEKEDSRVYNFYNTVFHGKQVNLNDPNLFLYKKSGSGYFIL